MNLIIGGQKFQCESQLIHGDHEIKIGNGQLGANQNFAEFGKILVTDTMVENFLNQCDCGQPGEDEHSCPYSDEIGTGEVRCNCRDECRHQCAMDI